MKDVIERLKEQSGTFAFPFISQEVFCPGMTLRDYFAAKAMQGIIELLRGGAEASESVQNQMAESAYQIADAMLKTREK